MRSTLPLILAAILVVAMACVSLAVADPQPGGAWLAGSLLVAFFLGLGVGERSRGDADRDLQRINRLLGDQNQALRESNLELLRARDWGR